jgi:PAS domain S-box-containing protein
VIQRVDVSSQELTPREIEVLALIAVGHSPGEIGERLKLSPRTVGSYRTSAFHKLRLTSRADVVAWAFHNGQVLDEQDQWDSERFLATVRQAPLMVLVADAEMHFRDASDPALRELGYSLEELLTLRVPDIVLDEAEAERRYASYRMTGVQYGTITLRRRDRTSFEASYAATTRYTGDVAHYVSVLVPE